MCDPTYPTGHQPSYPLTPFTTKFSYIEKNSTKICFPILFKTFLSYLISSDFFFSFPFRAFVLHFFIHSVSTSSGHKPKRNDQKKRGNENRRRRSDFEKKKKRTKIQRIYLDVAGAGPDQSSLRPSERNRHTHTHRVRERKRRQQFFFKPKKKKR